MRVLFYGTPAFALPTLRALLAHHHVVAVVTQPDRPAGRGQRAQAPPIKVEALAHGIPVLQPVRLRDPGWPERLAAHPADVAVVVAFGQILPPAVLAVPLRGSINVHASLLPRYRGAAPVAWAIIRGERETGISTFQMDAGMDTGPVLLRRATAIGPDETAGELTERLAVLGAETLLETLDRLDGLAPHPQDSRAATLAPRLRKEDGPLDWTEPAVGLAARIRGLNPWPGAETFTPGTPGPPGAPGTLGGRLLIWRAQAMPGQAEPGVLTPAGRHLAVGTGAGLLLPLEVQPENRRAMGWEAYLRGARLGAGAPLGATVPRS
jgi:methionyl-tRNA formyltransferase